MRHVLGALALILIAVPAGAQTMSGNVKVSMVRTGWPADSFAVVTDGIPEDFVNPANCPNQDGYVSTKPAPGFATYYQAALLALQLQVPVQVTVANTGCTAGRPKLIGINLLRK